MVQSRQRQMSLKGRVSVSLVKWSNRVRRRNNKRKSSITQKINLIEREANQGLHFPAQCQEGRTGKEPGNFQRKKESHMRMNVPSIFGKATKKLFSDRVRNQIPAQTKRSFPETFRANIYSPHGERGKIALRKEEKTLLRFISREEKKSSGHLETGSISSGDPSH